MGVIYTASCHPDSPHSQRYGKLCNYYMDVKAHKGHAVWVKSQQVKSQQKCDSFNETSNCKEKFEKCTHPIPTVYHYLVKASCILALNIIAQSI